MPSLETVDVSSTAEPSSQGEDAQPNAESSVETEPAQEIRPDAPMQHESEAEQASENSEIPATQKHAKGPLAETEAETEDADQVLQEATKQVLDGAAYSCMQKQYGDLTEANLKGHQGIKSWKELQSNGRRQASYKTTRPWTSFGIRN